MDAKRKNTLKAAVSLIAIAASGVAFFAMFGPEGCGPSEEEQRLLSTLNSLDEVLSHGGYIKQVQMFQEDDHGNDNVYHFEADIVDENGVAIGRLRGGRVEGFGTMKPRIKWYKTPGVPEEWERDGRGRRGRRDRGEGGRRDRPEGAPPAQQ